MGEIIRTTKGGRFLGWYIRYMDADGKRKKLATHQPTKELARLMLVEIEARVARGLPGIPEPEPTPPTVAELVDRFLVEYRGRRVKDLEKYRRFARSALRRVTPLIGELPADTVTRGAINRLIDALSRDGAPGTVRLTLTFIKIVFAWARREGLVDANPFTGVDLPQQQDVVEFLTREEVGALLSAADAAEATDLQGQVLRVAVHLGVRTGLRKGELFGLRWRDLDMRTRRLTVARSFATTPKSGKVRHLRLPAALLPILAEWARVCPATAEGLVLPRFRGGRWSMMASPTEMLGLPALLADAGCHPIARCWHALRHTFASHFVMSGGNILALQKILGHSDVRMTMIYAHLAPDYLGDEMERVKF